LGKKMKKLGNNQYTKNRESAAASPHGRKRNTAGTSSGEENVTNGDNHLLPNGASKDTPDHIVGVKGKFGKGKHKAINGNGTKHEDPADMTIANMKRRVEAMTTFIAKAQMETASGDRTPSGSNLELVGMAGGAVQAPGEIDGDGGDGVANGRKFEEMSAMEMADVVSRNLIGWQRKFGHLV
jgi:hypothetical protein